MRDIRDLATQFADRDQEDEPPISRGIEERPLLTDVFYALQRQHHIYAGTVPLEEIARRRAKNRHARRARRGNTAAIARQARINHAHNTFSRFRVGQSTDPFANLAALYGDA